MPMTYGDMETFIHDFSDKLIRFWVYKKVFTPYEVDKKFIDQSDFESSTATFGYIRVAVNLGGGDYLLGIEPYFGDDNPDKDLWFYRLSEIRFNILEIDQLEEE